MPRPWGLCSGARAARAPAAPEKLVLVLLLFQAAELELGLGNSKKLWES